MNTLATLEQIAQTPSCADGIPQSLEDELRAYGCKLIHEAGILLKQKQVAVATAQILFQRFWYVSSMKQYGIGETGMGALYVASKLEECQLRIRDLINVYDLLLQRAAAPNPSTFRYSPMSYFGNTFYELKDAIVVSEMQILKRLAFNMHVALPYGTLINYLRVLGLTESKQTTRAWGYLNDALQTPVYALYSIPTVVSAAILLAVRHLGVSLPDRWWVLFDAEWEDVWSVAGWIMRLYQPCQHAVAGMLHKKDVRKWLELNVKPVASTSS
ncbi:Cyclin-like protein [Mycena chlorophos]|uniref:Cyclin-like protein n=1 Tax=Mycena chlorophos TaxID=658473 RepID=A0A8H6TTN3_MYCCL|nr:Cyclin-like protein [Mycena chlorophos]